MSAAPAAAQDDAPFADTPTDAWYTVPVSALAADGVFAGTECDEGFCPGEPIDRQTMAVWVVRVLDGADPPAVSQSRFGDVDADGFHAPFIERMHQLGVTGGCRDGRGFCPHDNVNRAQMAAFLSRAFNLADGPDPGFADVPADAWYAAQVAKLAASGVTEGCGDGSGFCPQDDVTRAQMATFLWRGQNLDRPQQAPGQFTAVSAGNTSACGIRIDRTIACWGNDWMGNVSDAPRGQFTAVSAGAGHACAIRTDRTAVCWGDNRGGNLDVPDGQFTAISAGYYNGGCAIRPDKTVVCWGDDRGERHTEVLEGQFTAISTGNGQACGIRTDNTVVCSGLPDLSGFSNFDSDGVFEPEGQFTAFSAGNDMCGLFTDGNARCWWLPTVDIRGPFTAISEFGEFCGIRIDKTIDCVAQPFTFSTGGAGIPPDFAPEGQFTAVSGGGNMFCGIETDKTVVCWGATPSTGLWAFPPGDNFRFVDAYTHPCGIRTDRTIACWGNRYGLYGEHPDGQFTAISVTIDYSCGIRTDSTAVCWSSSAYSRQTDAFDVPNDQFTAISVTYRGACGIRTDRTVACWGDNSFRQADAPDGHFTAISRMCGIRTDRTVACWGDNRFRPADTPDGHFTAISVAGNRACGIRTDRTVACWGDNRFRHADTPDGHFTAISAGSSQACAIRTDSTAVCWGSNPYGQADAFDAPDGHFTAISAGSGLACAIKTDETAQCWNWTRFLPQGVQLVLSLPPDTAVITAAEAEVARLVNELRQSLGLAALSHDTGLAGAARRWSRTMRDTGQFVHDPFHSLQGPTGCAYGGENIATASGTTIMDAVQRVFDGWVASPGHYANMINPDFNRLGVGVVVEGSAVWFTQRFASCP